VRGTQRSRTFSTALILLQGLVTALFPQLSVKFIKQMIDNRFENAGDLEAKPEYVKQLRALGIGTVAAAGTSLLLQSTEDDSVDATGDDETDEDDE
jgi:hypothetical protein